MRPPAEALWLGSGLPLAAISVLWLAIGLVAGLALASAVAVWALRGRLGSRGPEAPDPESRAVASELARSRDLTEAARILVEQVQARVGVDAAALLVVDEDGRSASGACGRANGRDLDVSSLRFELDNEPSGVATAVFEAAPFMVFDAAAAVRGNGPLGESVPLQSVAYVPLVADERVVGVLVLGTTSERRAFTTSELALLETLAQEAAPGIELARATSKLSAALERERRRLVAHGALLQAAQSLTSVLQLDAVLQRLVQQVAELLEADAADCFLLDADRNVLRCEAVHGLPESLVGFEFPAQTGLSGRALEAGGAVADDEYGSAEQPVPNEAYAGFGAALVAPMLAGSDVQGVVGVGARGPRRFDEDDADLLEAFASVASLALTNVQTFDARFCQARQLASEICSDLSQFSSANLTIGPT